MSKVKELTQLKAAFDELEEEEKAKIIQKMNDYLEVNTALIKNIDHNERLRTRNERLIIVSNILSIIAFMGVILMAVKLLLG